MGELSSVKYQRVSTVLILLLSVKPAFTGYSWSGPSQSGKSYHDNSIPKGTPQFDDTVTSDIFVTLGQTAYLPCVVRNLGDRVVSWIKTKDLHILTSGKFTYTADSRMDVVYDPDAESWTLRIVRSRLTDVGKYECQVNTDPKMNKFFSLSIRETPLHDSPPISRADGSNIRATIAGPEEQYVKIGSTVTFECRLDYGTSRQGWEKSHARFSVRSIPNVQWLKDGLAVSFQAERGGISVETERGEKTGSSRLTLASVGSGDSGRYTCTGLGITPSTVTLNVIEGENHLEVMQRDDYNAMPSDSSSNLLQRSVLLIFGQKFSKLFLCNIFIIFAANYYLHYGIRYR